MLKLRIGVLLTSGLLALSITSSAGANPGGDSNTGDVGLDNVGQPARPGHDMDLHLACQDIYLWGSRLADTSGAFTIHGWPPSGSQHADYSGTWSSSGTSGEQTLATIDVAKLVRQAEANGDAADAQGLHFKLDFSQDPQKQKTFWIDCPPSPPGGGSSGGGTTAGGGGPTPSGGGGTTSGAGSPTTGSGTVGTPAVATTAGPVKTSIGGVSVVRAKPGGRRRQRGLVHPARHRTIRRRHVKAVTLATPPFTG